MIKLVFFLIPFFIYFFNKFFLKKKILKNFSGELHQKLFGKKNVPLVGGIFLILLLIPVFFFENNIYLFLFLIFIVGLSSDNKFISSPSKRFFLQTLIILMFVFFLNIEIEITRVILLDFFLTNFYFSIFFSYFCLIILVNGTNFIDGLNGLVLGYYFIISIIILKLTSELNIVYNYSFLIYLIYILLILLVFNLLNKFYLGDNGSYVISLFFGYYLIEFYNINQKDISPFFIILLLWYPCFENLFSIIRKFKINKSPLNPDSNHLHQLMYYFLKKKLNKNNFLLNNLASVIINIYNLSILFIGSLYFYHSQILLILIIINILLYTTIYFRLFKFKFNF